MHLEISSKKARIIGRISSRIATISLRLLMIPRFSNKPERAAERSAFCYCPYRSSMVEKGRTDWVVAIFSPVCAVFCLMLVAFSFYPFISCLPEQPLVREVKSAMPPDVFAAMQACLSDHPLTGGAVLGQNAFRKTRGFVIAFNREGLEEFRNDVRFECLHPYFERAALEEANAWVLNLLICHEPTYSSDVVVRSDCVCDGVRQEASCRLE